ncbi:MAG: putative oxidoreductase [Verrucomicrobiota bacterium]|jgi:uncharacterized membrane protein YphA (DoxX/SURF4 family)
MKIVIHIVRILLGLTFVVFGSNAFLHFIPMPPLPQNDAGAFIGAMMHSGYMQFVAAWQVLGGLCLLSGRLAPLGLLLLGPVIVNILAYHMFLDHMFNPIALLVAVLAAFLLWVYRYKFPAIFRP